MKRMLWNQCWWKDIIIAWIPAAMDGMVERSRQSRCHDLEPRVPSLLTATTTSIDFMESKIPQVCGVLGRRLKTIVITEIIIAAGKKFQVNGKRNGWECQPWWGQKSCSEKLKKQKTDRELIIRRITIICRLCKNTFPRRSFKKWKTLSKSWFAYWGPFRPKKFLCHSYQKNIMKNLGRQQQQQ